jgi:hypothetical protein
MLEMLILLGRALTLACRGHEELVLENLALRQQLTAMKRTTKRPRLRIHDRLFWIALARLRRNWRTALVLCRSLRALVASKGQEKGNVPSTHDLYTARVRPILRSVGTVAALVLLVGGASAAGLLLLRATRRRKEIAVRTALGASVGAIARMSSRSRRAKIVDIDEGRAPPPVRRGGHPSVVPFSCGFRSVGQRPCPEYAASSRSAAYH